MIWLIFSVRECSFTIYLVFGHSTFQLNAPWSVQFYHYFTGYIIYIYSNLVKKILVKREADSYDMLPTIEMPNYVNLDTLSYCMGIFPWENHVKSFMNGKYILLIYEKIGGCLGHLPNLRHWWWYIKMHIESEWMWPKRRPLIFLPTYICTYLRYTNGIFLMGYHEPYSIKRP